MADVNLVAKLQELERAVMLQKQYNDKRTAELDRLENTLRQGLVPNKSTQDLERNISRNMMNAFVPGNVGDINKVLWPFWFSTDLTLLEPGQNVPLRFSVTQEAGFAYMSLTKTVFDFDDVTNELTYVDPDEPVIGESPGLSYILRDPQSGREFHNIPQSLDMVGNPRWPAALPVPYFYLPNSNVEFSVINSHPTNIYYVQITLFGYRVRVEDARQILSLTYK